MNDSHFIFPPEARRDGIAPRFAEKQIFDSYDEIHIFSQ